MGRTKNWKKGYGPLTNKDLHKERELAEEDLKEYNKYKLARTKRGII